MERFQIRCTDKLTETIPVCDLDGLRVADIEQHGSVESLVVFLLNHKYSEHYWKVCPLSDIVTCNSGSVWSEKDESCKGIFWDDCPDLWRAQVWPLGHVGKLFSFK